jgi:DNA polymerase-3 subunit delta
MGTSGSACLAADWSVYHERDARSIHVALREALRGMADELADLRSVYLIYGKEPLLVERALERLKGRFAKVGDASLDLMQYRGDVADATEILNACNTLPLLSEKRLVIVRDVDSLDAEDQRSLAAYVAEPSPTTILVLVGEKLNKSSRLYKSVDAAGGVHEYKAPYKREYPAKTVELMAERGYRLSYDDAERLVRATGADLRRIDAELEKLVAFLGERRDVTTRDVEQVVASSPSVSVFELSDAVGARECERALRMLGELLDGGESVHGVHALLTRRVRELMAARSLRDRGEGTPARLSANLGRPEWQVRELPRQAARFTPDELVDALRGAAATEAAMKTSRDARLALERWIMQVCGA